MDPAAFTATLDSWHDFYLAVGSASAALLGLLFVGVSINLASVVAAERVDLRTRANLAFSNLLYLLGLSLIVLIPGAESTRWRSASPSSPLSDSSGSSATPEPCGAKATPRGERHGTIRRLTWTFVADVLLLGIAAALAADRGWRVAHGRADRRGRAPSRVG